MLVPPQTSLITVIKSLDLSGSHFAHLSNEEVELHYSLRMLFRLF